MFIEQVTDSMDYTSGAVYDYAKQLDIESIDTNSNAMYKEYDSFGRPVKVYTDYDSSIPAVEFKYYHTEFPARAVSLNKIHLDDADTETLDTVIIIDGLRRVIQTKKEGEIASQTLNTTIYGMNVSGLVEYDEMGRVILQSQPVFVESNSNTDPDDPYSIYGYEQVNQKNPTEIVYDAQGRQVKTILPDNAEITNEYEIENNLLKTTVTDPKGNQKVSYINAKQNILQIDQCNNNGIITTKYEYSILGEITKVIDADNNTTEITYDTLGRRASIDNPDSGLIEYTYDANSNLIAKVDNNLRKKSQKIKYEYDNAGRLTKVDYPESKDIVYNYGTANSTNYNRAGRLVSVSDESGTTEFYYGELGEQEKVIKTFTCLTDRLSREYEFSYQYDYLGRTESITYPGTNDRSQGITRDPETIYYKYDKGGAIKSVIGRYPDVATDIVYVKDIKYDEFGQRVYMKYGNGVETKYTYDEDRRWLTNIKTGNTSGEVFQNMDYEFDEVGNVLSITNNIVNKVTQTFEYDDLYQLTYSRGSYENNLASRTNDYEQIYKYDKIGNITGKVSKQWYENGKGENDLNYDLSYTYDADHPHRAVTIDDVTYDYDDNGNLTKKYIDIEEETTTNTEPGIVLDDPNSADYAMGWSWSTSTSKDTILAEYEWNEENRLTKASVNNTTVNYLYNAGGDRTYKEVEDKSKTAYVDKLYQVQIGDHKGCITKHIFVGASRLVSKVTYEDLDNSSTFEQNNYYWYHSDHLGSSNFISDTDGNEFEHIEYMPYGETWFEDGGNSVNNYITYKFTGKELDSTTGLYYFGARYYDPKTSLWISADPALGSYLPTGNKENDARLPGMGGAFNHLNLALYHYAGNNPLKYTDPTGEALALAAPLALPGSVMTVLIAALPYLIAIGIAAGIIFLIHQYRHNSDFRNFVNKNRDNIKNISMETIKNIAKTLTPNPGKDPKKGSKPFVPIPIGPDTTIDTEPKDDDSLNAIRIQVQTGKNTPATTGPITQYSKIGVLKEQAYGGLLNLYEQMNQIDTKLANSKEFRTAIIKMSKKIKTCPSISGGGNVFREEFIYNKKLYRIDLENLRGVNLKN